MDKPAELQPIDLVTLAPIVRLVLGRDTVELADWRGDVVRGEAHHG